MKYKDDLFSLIKSLSKAEKRYFKLSASIYSGDKAYLRMFDSIEKQVKYNEALIKKKFRGELFVKRFSFYKKYLYVLIQETLCIYESDKTLQNKIRKQINQIRVSFNRVRSEKTLKEIDAVEKTARKNETFFLLAQLYNLKLDFLFVAYSGKDKDRQINETFAKLYEALDKDKNLLQYRNVTKNVLEIHRNIVTPRTSEDNKALDAILEYELLADESRAVSVHSKLLFYECHFLRYSKRYDMEAAYACVLKQLKIINSSELHHILNPYYNKCECEILLKKYSAAFDSLKVLNKSNTKLPLLIFLSYTHTLQLYVSIGDFSKALVAFNEMKKTSVEIADFPNSKISLLFLGAVIHFGNNDLSEAKKCLQEIIADNSLSHLNNVNLYTIRLMYLLVLYEMEETEYLMYQAVAVKRYLLKHRRFHLVEKLLLDFFISEVKGNSDKGETKEKVKKLKSKLEKIMLMYPPEKVVVEYFDLIAWLESKIEGKSFAEVIRNKAASFTSPA